MSEQQQRPKSFMQKLDDWTQTQVIDALYNSDPIEGDWEKTVEQVKKTIRAKVLESYRNGLQAAPRSPKQPQKGAR
jgi:hypothetical protein